MKIVLNGIEGVFDCGQDKVWTIAIENQDAFYAVISDIGRQIEGSEGESVLSEDNKVIRMDKYAEMITQFVPFDMNKKVLLNKITSELQKLAMDDEHYMQANELLMEWERFCLGLEFEMPINIEFTKISIESLVKAAGIMIVDDYENLAEKIIDYMQLVELFEGKKLFIFVNLRSFIGDPDLQLFIDAVIKRKYQILMLENKEYRILQNEKRYLIDEDMCEICYNNE